MRIRQGLDRTWERLGGRNLALVVLALLVLFQIAALTLPQVPVTARDDTSFTRWLAELYPELGFATRALAATGLLTIRSSLLLRLTLALLGLVVVATADRMREAWQATPWSATPWSHSRSGQLLICLGGLLIIGGWAGQMSAGWREPEVIVWPDDPIVIEARDLTIAQPAGPIGIWKGGYGHYVIARGKRVGLEASAADATGASLPLLPAVNEAPLEMLRLTFTTQQPEAFFAITEAELIFRLNQVSEGIQVQAYRSASGEPLTETLLEPGDATALLPLRTAEVSIAQTLLPRYEVVYNPGAAFEGLGMTLLALGVVLSPGGATREQDAVSEGAAPDSTDQTIEQTG